MRGLTRLFNPFCRSCNRHVTKSYNSFLTGGSKTFFSSVVHAAFSSSKKKKVESIGLPIPATHPHMFGNDQEVTPGFTVEEYRERRKTLCDIMPPNSLYICLSNSLQIMTNDIPYTFRQDTDFSYLTGFDEPNSLLFLSNKDGKAHSTLIVQPKDKIAEMWDGIRCGQKNALKYFGVDKAGSMSDYKHIFEEKLCEHEVIVFKHKSGVAIYDKVYADLKKIFRQFEAPSKLPITNPEQYLSELRLIKTQMERARMQKVCEISSEVFKEVMRFTKPGITEQMVDARLEYEARIRGCQRLAYPPVVAAGANGLTLHYIKNNQKLKDGELILIDAGGEYHDYASDITRTFPVNGTFTKPQRQVYEAVLKVNEDIIKLCRIEENSVMSLSKIHTLSVYLFSVELRKLGIIDSTESDYGSFSIVQRYYPHAVGHFLGMDTHDTPIIEKQRPFKEGMVITVEPGLYFPEDDPAVPEKFRGIAVRIEDNILITNEGPKNLTKNCPKTIDEIEAVMNS